MGRKKGKQSGDFPSKSQYALHRHTVYVDHASEANRYRNTANPSLMSSSSSSHVLGRGSGYRNCISSSSNNMDRNIGGGGGAGAGYWHANGTAFGGGDKWSNIFNRKTTGSTTFTTRQQHHPTSGTNNAIMLPVDLSNNNISSGENVHRRGRSTILGFSRLRSLLEERRVEDRLYDREHRLRLQRSRLSMMDSTTAASTAGTKNTIVGQLREDRHEPGWLLSHQYHPPLHETKQPPQSSQPMERSTTTTQQHDVIPSLQVLAARTLGPILPLYCTACGAEYVGRSLKSVSAEILSELTISLANTYHREEEDCCWPSTSPIMTMTNGVVKAIMYSGVATGIVLRGSIDGGEGGASHHHDIMYDNDDDKCLSDEGLLSLCPRILPSNHPCGNYDGNDDDNVSSNRSEEDQHSSWEEWEIHDFYGLNSRMLGCFHLKRLELIDVPLLHDMSTSTSASSSCSGGITVQGLWTLLRSCSGITHLSLSGCFSNWEDAAIRDIEDIGLLLGGNQSVSSLSNCIDILGKRQRHGSSVCEGEHLLPYLDFHHIFDECSDERNDIPALSSMLPDLRVLDVSHCVWVDPEMIIRLVLNGWKRCFSSVGGVEYQNECKEAAETSDDNRTSANIYPTLRHINIRGCTRLLSGYTWRRFGLFDGIDISTERQKRT
jgi:hypothetical protein